MKTFRSPLSLRSPRTLIHSWAIASQHTARRNAMVAATDLAARRAELLDVQEFLVTAGHRRAVLAGLTGREAAPAGLAAHA